MSVIVVGSANRDTTVSVRRHPGPGETVLAVGSRSGPGGKGLNQAVAAARAGADAWFVGVVGDDEAGAMIRDVLAHDGVRTRLAVSDHPTGAAFVMVAEGGENAIVVVAGAGGDADALSREADAVAASASPDDVVLAQLEVPVEVAIGSLRSARGRGARTVLNAAPSRPLSAEMLEVVDILVVNQHECLDLAGARFADVDGAAASLAERVGAVVVTLGEDGAIVHAGGEVTRVPAFRTEVVDTTAAGDTFCGALAARLAAGDGLQGAVRFASAAAALCVQRPGAAASAPLLDEIRGLLAQRWRESPAASGPADRGAAAVPGILG